jgi:hypothetical protein
MGKCLGHARTEVFRQTEELVFGMRMSPLSFLCVFSFENFLRFLVDFLVE